MYYFEGIFLIKKLFLGSLKHFKLCFFYIYLFLVFQDRVSLYNSLQPLFL